MAAQKATVKEVVLVENSDERLAAAEHAKMTGEPFRSTESRGSEAIPREVAQELANNASNRDTFVDRFGATYAGHLENWHNTVEEDPYFVLEANAQKAEAHDKYSAEYERQRRAAEAETRRRMVEEGYDPALAVQERNEQIAAEHDQANLEYVRRMLEADRHTVEEVATGGDYSEPNANEEPAEQALVDKDAVITVEQNFEAHAVLYAESEDSQQAQEAATEAPKPRRSKKKEAAPEESSPAEEEVPMMDEMPHSE